MKKFVVQRLYLLDSHHINFRAYTTGVVSSGTGVGFTTNVDDYHCFQCCLVPKKGMKLTNWFLSPGHFRITSILKNHSYDQKRYYLHRIEVCGRHLKINISNKEALLPCKNINSHGSLGLIAKVFMRHFPQKCCIHKWV